MSGSASMRRGDFEKAQTLFVGANLSGETSANLAKRIRGQLVPQDPNDEPASVLLERIKAERNIDNGVRRGRRSKT